MRDYLFKYLTDDLLPRISAYKSPTEPQKTIMHLYKKMKNNGSLDDEDMTLLELHVKAERQAEKLFRARQRAQEIEKKRRDTERKHKTRMKIVLGGLVEKHIKNDSNLRSSVVKLINGMDSTDKDKELLKTHLKGFNVDFGNVQTTIEQLPSGMGYSDSNIDSEYEEFTREFTKEFYHR